MTVVLLCIAAAEGKMRVFHSMSWQSLVTDLSVVEQEQLQCHAVAADIDVCMPPHVR